MRYKHYGIWQSYSWQDYLDNVKYLALGLLALGFEPGDKLLIVGDNCPEWYFAELAAQCDRGVSVGLYSDLLGDRDRAHRPGFAAPSSPWSRTRSRRTRSPPSATGCPTSRPSSTGATKA